MFGIFYLSNIFQLIVYRFNNRPFSDQNLVIYVHKNILHVVLDFGDELNSVQEQCFKKCPTYISFICTQLSLYIVQERSLFQWFSIIYVCSCKHEVKDLSFVIDYQMQFESEEPSHRTLPTSRQSLKSLVDMDSLVSADTQGSRIHKANSSTCSK